MDAEKNLAERSKIITHASIVDTLVNLSFGVAKLIMGLTSHSVAIMSDAVNNLGDAVSGVLTFVGTRLAEHKPTKKHPYGFGRLEYLTALIIASLIITAGFEFARVSYERIIHPVHTSVTTLQIVIMTVTVIGKVFLYFFNKKNGEAADSSALLANAKDSVSDAVSTGFTVVGVAADKLTHMSLDGYIGLLVSLFILYSGFSSLLSTVSLMVGTGISQKLQNKIRTVAMESPDVLAVEDMRVYSYGPERRFGSMTVQVRPSLSLEATETLLSEVQKALRTKTGVIFTLQPGPIPPSVHKPDA